MSYIENNPDDKNPEAPTFIGIQVGTDRNFSRTVSRRGLAAASANEFRSVLNRKQLLACGDAVTNDGILRALLNKLVYSIKGERPKFLVDINEELTEFANEEEKKKLENDILINEFGAKIKTIKQNTVRINKRCQFSERLDQLIFTTFTFGRNALQIIRFPTGDDFPIYGEPRALKLLNSVRISDVSVDPTTGDLRGLFYDWGGTKGKKLIKSIDMIPAFFNDYNLYDNTNYSGLPLVWSVLSISQANTVINDEDIPEATKQLWAKFGFVFAGTSKKSVLKKIREIMEASSWVVHNQKDLKAQVEDLAHDLMELPNLRTANAKYMSWCMMMPLFLMFEDDANFATAAQAIQAFKVGVIDYYRTWIRGWIEKYWYDPILADQLGVPVEDVIAQKIKIKCTFEDLIYDPFADKVDAYVKLKQSGIYGNEKILKELDAFDELDRQRQVMESEEVNKLRTQVAEMTQKLVKQTQMQKDNPDMIQVGQPSNQ